MPLRKSAGRATTGKNGASWMADFEAVIVSRAKICGMLPGWSVK